MKKVLLVLVAAVAALSLNAQRVIDLEVTLNSPTPATTITSGGSFNVNFVIKNLGPDKIKTGDSIFIGYYIDNSPIGGTTGTLVFNKDIEKDSMVPFGTNGFSITFGSNLDGPHNFCAVAVLNRGADGDTIADNTLNNNAGCAAVTLSSANSIGEINNVQADNISVYPNPVATEATIAYNMVKSGNVSIKIMDITGRVVADVFSGVQEAGAQSVKVNTDNLNNGIYFYQLEVNGLSFKDKIVVAK
jgi:hypothetical protein